MNSLVDRLLERIARRQIPAQAAPPPRRSPPPGPGDPGPIGDASSPAPATGIAPDQKIVELMGGPATITGDPDDPYFQSVNNQAYFLAGLHHVITGRFPRSAVAVDVGANIGLSTIMLARHFAKVVAFEPSPRNVGFLKQNLAANGLENVEVVAAAASDREGSLLFHQAAFGAGSHVVGDGHLVGSTIPTIEVPSLTLDAAVSHPVDFIKIDAEGHEPDVIAGARRLLLDHGPLIYTEINAWCLSAFSGCSLGTYVSKLFEYFDVSLPQADGSLAHGGDAYGFLHDLITAKQGVADVLLRHKADRTVPTVEELTWPGKAFQTVGHAAG